MSILVFKRNWRNVGLTFKASLLSSLIADYAAGSSTPTFTRTTVATVRGYASGAVSGDSQVILSCASGEARFSGARRVSQGVWSPVLSDGTPIPATTLLGALAEGVRTNLCLQSNAFTTTPWGIGGTLTAVQNAIGPDGTTSAWTLTDTDAAVASYLTGTVALTADAYTFSMFIRKTVGAQASYPVMFVYTGTKVALATIDTSNGVLTPWTAYTSFTMLGGVSVRCASFNANFWRAEMTFTGTAATYTVRLLIAGTANATQSTGTQNGTLAGVGCVVANAQVELGSFASSYIPTTTVSVLKNADIDSYATAGNINSASGTVYLEFTPQHAPSGTIALWGTYVDASNYSQLLHDGTNYIWRCRIAATNYDATITSAFVSGTSYKLAVTWGAGGKTITLNGVEGTPHANTTAIQVGATFQTGADGNSLQQAGGSFKSEYLWLRQLSASERLAVTA